MRRVALHVCVQPPQRACCCGERCLHLCGVAQAAVMYLQHLVQRPFAVAACKRRDPCFGLYYASL